ncbi:carotenoid cleavage dioxygenase 1 [Moniliophthora roreri]|uniref:Carotenoid oxygenase n=1 Tax=Moniliophthora roreri TaxID=221103 RepID=A0A0W0F8G7_MONRR|nr:carotenoid cleavage dioxygenase 1 [Moniliophthora roreri]
MQSPTIGFQNAPEQRDPVDLTIQGTIPPWLCGVLYRTGPGTYQVPTASDPSKSVSIQHWFDGLSMNHRFEIHPGGHRVSYRSRKAADNYEEEISKQEKMPGATFGQQPDICQTIFRKFFTVFKQAVSGNGPVTSDSPSGVNVGVTLTPDMPGWDKIISNLPTKIEHQHGGPQYIVAKTDASSLQLIDPVSLEPLYAGEYKSLDPRLDGQLSAAHSCRDKETNEFFNFSCKLGGRFPTYKVFKIKGNGQVDILAEVKDAPASYLHSFAMTSKYVILVIWQAHYGLGGLSILAKNNLAQAIEKKWNLNDPSLFYVIDRKKGGIVAKYESPPFFCFHQINAFDDPKTDDIVIDMSVYEDNSVIDLLYVDKLRHPTPETLFRMGQARRFRLSSVTTPSKKPRKVIVEFTAPEAEGIELPAIHPAKYHKPYRYAYGINRDPSISHTFADRIIRLDMEHLEGGSKTWCVPGYTTSEPIFVPRPGADAEDDGVVLSVVLDVDKGRSMLVILDAKDMKELARAEMQTAFPIGFHGVWSHKNVAAL